MADNPIDYLPIKINYVKFALLEPDLSMAVPYLLMLHQ